MIGLYDELSDRAIALSRLNLQLSELNGKLQEMANTDELTGLLNRRQAMLRLEEHWSIAQRYAQPFSCAMVDVDHFKSVNDRYGHLKGDEVLQRIGRVLSSSVRDADCVCRIGGEEFLILFPQQTASEASISAERCRQQVDSEVSVSASDGHSITLSVGVAERSGEMKTPDDLLKEADRALYEAKNEGRNRVVRAVPAATA